MICVHNRFFPSEKSIKYLWQKSKVIPSDLRHKFLFCMGQSIGLIHVLSTGCSFRAESTSIFFFLVLRIYKSTLYKLWCEFPLNIMGRGLQADFTWILLQNTCGFCTEIYRKFFCVRP